jgi:hypothetical protein
MVYQLESYRYWASYFGRSDLVAGSFGENLTVEGLADAEVCIGDRFRIGGIVVEVSHPRETCYRVGIRLERPEMPALLVAHRRPGFYFRVIQEGEIGAGDRIVKLSDGPELVSAPIAVRSGRTCAIARCSPDLHGTVGSRRPLSRTRDMPFRSAKQAMMRRWPRFSAQA